MIQKHLINAFSIILIFYSSLKSSVSFWFQIWIKKTKTPNIFIIFCMCDLHFLLCTWLLVLVFWFFCLFFSTNLFTWNENGKGTQKCHRARKSCHKGCHISFSNKMLYLTMHCNCTIAICFSAFIIMYMYKDLL